MSTNTSDLVKRLRDTNGSWEQTDLAAREAADMIEDLRRDAARYRWLRRRAVMVDTSEPVTVVITFFRSEGPTGEFLDDQVDTLAQSKGEPK